MCFNPFKFIGDIFNQIFGGNPQPTGPKTHAKGLANRLRRPDAAEVEDTDLKKEKGDTQTDLSQEQGAALKRVADSTKQTGKTKQTAADLMAALSGLGSTKTNPTGGLTSPTGASTPKGGGGAGY